MLTCLHYDATTGKYTKDAVALMQVGGAVTVLLMGGDPGAALDPGGATARRDR